MDCCYIDRNAKKGTTLVVEEKEVSNLFMVQLEGEERATSLSLVDSGCSNHMSGIKELFKDLDESSKITVRLGDDKKIQVDALKSLNYNKILLGLPNITKLHQYETCVME